MSRAPARPVPLRRLVLQLGLLLVTVLLVLGGGFAFFTYQEVLEKASHEIQSAHTQLVFDLRRNLSRKDRRSLTSLLQQYVYSHPVFRRIDLVMDDERGRRLIASSRLNATTLRTLTHCRPLARPPALDFSTECLVGRLRIFDAHENRMRPLTVAYTVNRQHLLNHFLPYLTFVTLELLFALAFIWWLLRRVRQTLQRPMEKLAKVVEQTHSEFQLPAQLPVEELARLSERFAEYHRRQREMHDELYRLAMEDSLTGVLNRRGIVEELDRLVASCPHSDQVVVMLVDIDNFKTINELYGHAAGDELLRHLARACRSQRSSARLGRLGGDEFLLVWCQSKSEPVNPRLPRLKVTLPEAGEIEASCSAGVACWPDHGQNVDELLQAVDVALLECKRQGGGHVRWFDKAMQARMLREAQLRMDMHRALEEGWFHLVYQPQVETREGRIVAFEALARLEHPEFGPVSPAEFIPLVENSAHARAFGEWVVDTALRFLAGLKDNGRVCISLNIHRQMLEPAFIGMIASRCEALGVSPSQVTLELLERDALITHLGEHAELLAEIERHGMHLAIDDFGTGYSALGYLDRLPVDELKVDRSFVLALNEQGDAPLLRVVRQLAETLEMEAVVEGVESALQLQRLRQMGYSRFQGFLFSRPLPENEARALFESSPAPFASLL